MAVTANDGYSRNWLPTLSKAASLAVVGIGFVVILGYALSVPQLTRLVPAFVAMNPVTAFTLILAGLSLWRLGKHPAKSLRSFDYLGFALAGLVTLIAALRLADCVLGMGPYFDSLFSKHVSQVTGQTPNRMAANAALAFLFFGAGLLLIDVETRRRFRPAQALALIAGLIGLLALLGYTYRVAALYRLGTSSPMALESAVAFALLCLGFLAARPRSGFMAILTSDTTGGAVARRLLPLAIIVPWLLGVLLLARDEYEREFAVSIFGAASIVIFTVLIWWNAKLFYIVDVERLRSERRLSLQHKCTHILSEAPDVAAAAPRILESVCETLGWRLGVLWVLEKEANVLRATEMWSPAMAEVIEFVAVTRKAAFRKGEGLPGRVWQSEEPVWLLDFVTGPASLRIPQAAACELRGALGFPIWVGQDMYGVIEFFNRQPEQPDRMLLEVLGGIGAQIGQFIERKRAEELLQQTTANLERSNTELQQFAYVASHDLFEPLRMVISYLQLLSSRYKDKLDKQANEFIGFAVEGAQRMQALIHDLLAYSRVEMRGGPLEPTDAEQAFQAAVTNLKVAVEESGAAISHKPLPTVRADPVQLTQVFQNFIGNGLKFHGTDPPRIEVGAHRQNGEWLFFVRDNGIGIDPRNFDRIWVIFQRLHTRREFAGTGMGLAICKKIVERHGGRVWVESTPGEGSTFFFTLPASAESE